MNTDCDTSSRLVRSSVVLLKSSTRWVTDSWKNPTRIHSASSSACAVFPAQQQPRYDVVYKTVKVGEYIPDLIVFDLVVVDTKVIERITDHEVGQMLNYLKITGHPVGLILNFKRSRLEWKRVINY